MIEYNGWVAINMSTYEDDLDELEEAVCKIRKKIDLIFFEGRILELKAINGTYTLVVAGSTNHKSQDVIDIFDLYQLIKEITPGSYGILYFRDDENLNGKDNEFSVWVLKRGVFVEEIDKHLSPCIPTIEDGEE
ncbi:MAG: immunity 7 family protein [Deltaproteobacteria bacterium]|nr:immunity 7 family protein [Deltaproteobacteria bacterium]